jgi:hypothetical protein
MVIQAIIAAEESHIDHFRNSWKLWSLLDESAHH